MQSGAQKDKFIAFVDILGYKNMVDSALAGTGMPLNQLTRLCELLCKSTDRTQFSIDGPTVCRGSQYLSRDLDFEISQKTDCSLLSIEISPAGAINLISHCWGLVVRLLKQGVLCRGYITRGLIYHTPTLYEGPGFEEVVYQEKQVEAFKRDADDRGTPFVEIDQTVRGYVASCEDSCVREMFSRLVQDDGESAALFPFKRLVIPINFGGFGHSFDLEEEKQSIENTRSTLTLLKDRVKSLANWSNPQAVRKTEHYIQALDKQLMVCDELDEILEEGERPFLTRTIGDIWKPKP